MRSTEDIVRTFAQTDPTPREHSVGSKDDPSFLENLRQYQRERLALEVQLDIRNTLIALLERTQQ